MQKDKGRKTQVKRPMQKDRKTISNVLTKAVGMLDNSYFDDSF